MTDWSVDEMYDRDEAYGEHLGVPAFYPDWEGELPDEAQLLIAHALVSDPTLLSVLPVPVDGEVNRSAAA